MATYYIPDITGVNPLYRQANIPLYAPTANVSYGFGSSPVFAGSLVIKTTDGFSAVLVKDVDYTFTAADIDNTAMSQAFLENNAFAGTLVKSVTILSAAATGKQLAMSYQEFYLTTANLLFDDGTPLEVTPDLIKMLVSGLADVRQQVAKVASPVATNLTPPSLLPFDINCELPGNVVSKETITVNTVAGAKVIRLAQGAYFADTLTLSYNGTPLSVSTDYMPIGFSSLSQQSTDKGGIYQYILLVGTFTGNVTVSYHAVGGDVQRNDVNALYTLMVSIQTFLNNQIFLTSDTITQTPAFSAVHARLLSLEDNMRKLLSGSPTYGDSGAGQAVVRPVTSSDADFHWFTIATLYQVQGSPDIITADQFKGRVYFPAAKVSLAFTIDVNLTQSRNIVSFKTDGLVFDPTYTLFSSVSAAVPVYPLIRVVWNQTAQVYSGACLQIGIPLVNLNDRMAIEDMSTSESCWILDTDNAAVTGVTGSSSLSSDTGFTLPDGVSIWSTDSSSSYQEICVPRYDQGYLVYSGSSTTLSQINITTPTTGFFSNIALPDYFPCANIETITMTLMSSDSTIVYDVDIDMLSLTAGTYVGRTTFVDSQGELLVMAMSLTQDSTGAVTVSPTVSQVATSQTAPATPLTDTIRYIRAKV